MSLAIRLIPNLPLHCWILSIGVGTCILHHSQLDVTDAPGHWSGRGSWASMTSIDVITTTVPSAAVSTSSCPESLAAPPGICSHTITCLLSTTIAAVASGVDFRYCMIHCVRMNRRWNSGCVTQDKVGAMVPWSSHDSLMWSCTFREFTDHLVSIGQCSRGTRQQDLLHAAWGNDPSCNCLRQRWTVPIVYRILAHYSGLCLQPADKLGEALVTVQNFSNLFRIA